MLSSSVHTNPGAKSATSAQSAAGTPSIASAAVVENADTLSAGNTAQQKNSASQSTADFFSGELTAALINAEATAADTQDENFSAEIHNHELSEDTSKQNQDQHSQPDAEEWLQAMLEQQQLQLQTRDSTEIVNAPVAAAQHAETFVRESVSGKLDLGNQAVSANRDRLNSAKATAPHGFITPFDSAAKLAVNTNMGLAAGQQAPTNAMRTAETANHLLSESAPSATAATSAALLQPMLNDSAASESPLLTAGLTASSAENAQRLQAPAHLQTPEAKWGEQLLHTLRDNVHLQIQQKIQNATIRLDPPELGSLEIFISHESGRLHVQITASQADVARLIQHTSERLRQELSSPQFTQVDVRTSAEGQGGQQQSRERQRFLGDEMILANEQNLVDGNTATTRTSDVLVTV